MTCPLIKQNESTIDRIIRVLAGVAAFTAGRFVFSGMVSSILYLIGAIALVTGIIGFCGLYAILGLSTKKSNHK
jgi:hypothetical protein